MAQVTTRFFDQVSGVRRQLARVVHDIAIGLDALHRVQFEEPWRPVRRPMYGEW